MINLKKIVEHDNENEIELQCPKCRNDMLSYFHGTFILNLAISSAKKGRNAHIFKLINGELYSLEKNDWEKMENQYPPEIFVCKCGFFSESKYDFAKTHQTVNTFNEEINNSKKIIEEQNNKIKDLTNQLNKEKKQNKKLSNSMKELKDKLSLLNNEITNNQNKIKNLENIIKEKNIEINKFKEVKSNNWNYNNINNNNQYNQYNNNYNNMNMNNGFNNVNNNQFNYQNQMKCVTFNSLDNKIFFGIPCSGNNIFAEIEEKLYKEYPEYRETNNTFYFEGKEILRFKTINDNNIGNGRPITLVKPFVI